MTAPSRELDTQLPVLTITTRCEPRMVDVALAESVGALRETARRMGLVVVADPLRVHHRDDGVVEVCLPVDALPDAEPPPPVAAEVLVPGTVVDTVRLP